MKTWSLCQYNVLHIISSALFILVTVSLYRDLIVTHSVKWIYLRELVMLLSSKQCGYLLHVYFLLIVVLSSSQLPLSYFCSAFGKHTVCISAWDSLATVFHYFPEPFLWTFVIVVLYLIWCHISSESDMDCVVTEWTKNCLFYFFILL